MNKLTLIGHINAPTTYHCTKEGRDILRFTLATGGEVSAANSGLGSVYYPEITDHHCVAWGPAAVDLHQYLKAGDRLMIQGELHYRIHRGRNGELQRFAEVYVRGYTFLGDAATTHETPQERGAQRRGSSAHFAYRRIKS